MSTPVILLAFANEQENTSHYLRNLPLELNLLREALEKAEDKGLCEVVILSNTTLDNLISTFQREKYRNRIALFHYGGHADSYRLLLEDAQGKSQIAEGEGLVPFLANQKGLQSIFLNGCHSAQQAIELTQAGIPAVIGTSQAISDMIAPELAATYYRAIGEGLPLEQAWQEATYKIKALTGTKDLRPYYQQELDKEEQDRGIRLPDRDIRSQFPWHTYYRPGTESVKDWNLPAAANNPYFGLAEIPEHYRLPEVPYRFLERYTKEDARIFFGRGHYLRDLYYRITNVHAAPVILLYGQSGVGKSSLLEAGLFPRLEEDYEIGLVRRDPAIGLTGQLMQLLGISDAEASAEHLREKWKALESKSDRKSLLLVLDQVEEVYTRPQENEVEELARFLRLAAGIFANSRDQPKGKLLLSYRKEYDPEIEKVCREVGLPKEKVFLERLDRLGIEEVIQGLTSNGLLRNKYRLSIDETLPLIIADDLLTDRDSPISPVLQIILTRLWQQQEEKDQRQFLVADYQQLQRQGVFLDDFFQQQMAAINAWEKQLETEVVSNGLALDILHYHTTSLGTAESRNLEELSLLYQHRAEILDQLIQQFKSVYLLTAIGKDRSALAHDTLAPIVQKELNESDKPGQRAFRILTAKGLDYELNPDRTYLDEEDLALVERGAGGMRLWTTKEKDLIAKSQQRRAKLIRERKRNSRLKVIGVAIIVGLALVASLLAWQSNAQSEVNRLVSQALQEQEIDATKAMVSIKQAWYKLGQHPFSLDSEIAFKARHDIYSNNEFYQQEFPHQTDQQFIGAIEGVNISQNGQLMLAAIGNSALLWDKNQPNGQPLKFSHQAQVNGVIFSPDSKSILTVSNDASAIVWGQNGQKITELQNLEERIKHGIFSDDGETIFLGGHTGTAWRWSVQQPAQVYSWKAHPQDSITALCFLATQDELLTAAWDGKVYHWQWTGAAMELKDSMVFKVRPTTLDYDTTSGQLVIGFRDGTLLIRDLQEGTQKEIKAHDKGINQLTFSPKHSTFLSASNDYKIKLWSLSGELLKTYRGHSDFVEAIDFDETGDYFVSGGAEGKMKLWKSESKVGNSLELNQLGITNLDISTDGEIILLGTGEMDPYQDRDLSTAKNQNTERTNKEYPLLLWQPQSGQVDTLLKHRIGISSVAISSDDQFFLSGGRDGRAWVWDRQKNEVKFELIDTLGINVQAVAFSPGETGIQTAEDMAMSNQEELSLLNFWNWEGQREQNWMTPYWINDLALSPVLNDDKWLIAGEKAKDGYFYLFQDLEDENPQGGVVKSRKIRSVSFSTDGQYLAIGESGTKALVHVYETTKFGAGKPMLTLTFPADNGTGGRAITDIAFSADKRFVVASAEGGLLKLFDLQKQGREVMTINDFSGYDVSSVRFYSSTGSWVVVGSRDGQCRFYRNIALGETWF